jgi:hypothetical protein
MTHPSRRLDAVRATGALHVEHCDVPEEMTLDEWRRCCAAVRLGSEPEPRGNGMWRSVRRLLGA